MSLRACPQCHRSRLRVSRMSLLLSTAGWRRNRNQHVTSRILHVQLPATNIGDCSSPPSLCLQPLAFLVGVAAANHTLVLERCCLLPVCLSTMSHPSLARSTPFSSTRQIWALAQLDPTRTWAQPRPGFLPPGS